MSKNPIQTYAPATVEPVIPGGRLRPVNFLPNLSIVAGQLLAQVTAANVNEVQTLNFSGSGDIPTGGTFTLSVAGIDGGTFTTAALAYDISNANLKTAIEALFVSAGYDGVTVTLTNGPAPADVTVTFGGWAAAFDMPLMTGDASGLTSSGTATLSVVATTAGVSSGLYGPYVGTKLADPTDAPTVATDAGTTPSWAIGAYSIAYTWLTAQGETLPSPQSSLLLVATTGGAIKVTVPTLPTGATGANVYVNGFFAATYTTAGAKIINAPATTASKVLPDANTAFTVTNGRHIAKGISQYTFTTDNFGRVKLGGMEPVLGDYALTAPIWETGLFDVAALTGLTADAIANLGVLESGTISAGLLRVR